MFRPLIFATLSSVLLVAGCGQSSDERPADSAPEAAAVVRRTFQAKGVVVEVLPQERAVRIKHEAVTNYMPAMTMPFNVKDTNELAGLEPGDPVSFRLIDAGTDAWIEDIRKTGPKVNTPPTTGHFRLVRDVEPLNIGDPLPEYHFISQASQSFTTTQFKGDALAIEFLFTRCPYPTFCPLMANNFAKVQEKLLSMPGGPTNWHLLTISFDPEHDTPAVLKNYAESHNYNPARWTFATGELIDITAIGDQLTEAFWHDESGGISHNLRVAVFDASGRLQKIFKGNQWAPDDLVAEMVKAAGTQRRD